MHTSVNGSCDVPVSNNTCFTTAYHLDICFGEDVPKTMLGTKTKLQQRILREEVTREAVTTASKKPAKHVWCFARSQLIIDYLVCYS